MKVVIIGGVAGGATAAARIRRLDEDAQIVIYERSGYISYANCGLPYYVGSVITDKSALTLQTPESFFRRFRIEVNVLSEVIAVNAEKKTVTVRSLSTGEEQIQSYDKLIISTGAKPLEMQLSAGASKRIFSLRTVEDAFKIKDFTTQFSPKSAVICGGGFIGLEMAEMLRKLDIDVTLVQRSQQLFEPFDSDMASFIHSELIAKGVRLRTGCALKDIEEDENGLTVALESGERIRSDMALLALGVVPDSALAVSAGLKTGLKGAIAVNEHMQTSDSDIYAVGDAVQVENFVTGQPSLIPLAGPANKQGRIAADNICSIRSSYNGSQGSSVIKLFDLTAAVTGINEKTAKRCSIDAQAVILSPLSHAGYYPGATAMTMKVVFESGTLRLLGAQIIGYEGVDKRIDTLAVAIRAGMKADELAELELAYAPPYSSAKDPVNMAGYMIENIGKGLMRQWRLEDVPQVLSDGGAVLLDVRTKGEFLRGHIEGFINIPVDELREKLDRLDRSKRVYVICQSGLRSYIACRILSGNGFQAYNFAGGYRLYSAAKNDEVTRKRVSECGAEY